MRRPLWISTALLGILWVSLPAGGLRPPWAGGLAAALIWLCARSWGPVRFDGALRLWALWLAWAGLTVLACDQPLKGVYSLSRWAAVAVFFALVREAWGDPERGRWPEGLAASGVLLGFGALFIPSGSFPLSGFIPPYYNYTVFVEAACVSALVMTLGRAGGPRGARAWALACAGAFCLAMVLLARSRGGLAGIALAAAVSAWRRGRGRWLLGAGLLGAVLMASLPPERLEYLFKLDQRSSFNRPQIWRAALEVARENPFLGEGLGNFEQGFMRHNFRAGRAVDYGLSSDHAHSEALEALAETGLPGLLLLLAALGASAAPLVRSWKTLTLPQEAALGALVSMGTHCAVDNMLHLPALAFLFASALACAGRAVPAAPMVSAGGWGSACSVGLAFGLLAWLPGWMVESNWTLYQREEEPARRLQLAAESVKLMPADFFWRELLGRSWLQVDPPRPDLALREFERAAALNPTSGLYPHILAVIAHKNGDRAGARALVRKAVELEPNYFAARFFLTELLLEENLKAEARRELAEAARRRNLIRGLSTHSGDDARIVEFDNKRYDRLKGRLSP